MKKRIGYGNPPKEFQFESGKSGNPSGRPKKLPSMRQALEAELEKRVRIEEDGITVMAPKQVALVKNLVDAAVGGNLRAASAILSLLERDQRDDGQNAPDGSDDALLEEYIEREVQLRVTARDSGEDSK
jgi:hypothetical protein